MFSVETRIAFILLWGKMYFPGAIGTSQYVSRQVKLKTAQIFGISKRLLSLIRFLFFGLLCFLVWLVVYILGKLDLNFVESPVLSFGVSFAGITFLSLVAIFSPFIIMRLLMKHGVIRDKINYITLKRIYLDN